jgi:hypothetical protein
MIKGGANENIVGSDENRVTKFSINGPDAKPLGILI